MAMGILSHQCQARRDSRPLKNRVCDECSVVNISFVTGFKWCETPLGWYPYIIINPIPRDPITERQRMSKGSPSTSETQGI